MNRSLPRALGCALVALAVAGTLLVGTPGSAAPAADPVHRAGPGYHQPKVGSCHLLTKRQAFSPSAPYATVPCSQKHTSKTIVVKRLRGKVDWRLDNDIWKPIYGDCLRRAQRVLGNNDKARAMSAYQTFVFIPTKRERARGAKWMRCDLALYGGPRLQPLPDRLDLGSLPLDDAVARCITGPDSALLTTVCAKKHRYRVTGGFRPTAKRFPGVDRLARAAIRRCPKLTKGDHWRYLVPPNADQWRVGYRTITCYSKTRK